MHGAAGFSRISANVLPCRRPRFGVRSRSQRVYKQKRDGKVVCIGDDDLVGLTLARLGFEVTVLELDDYLVGLIEHVAKEEELSVTVECFDLCEPLDEAWRGRFDAFVTDPMSNEAHTSLFIRVGARCVSQTRWAQLRLMRKR